MMMGIGTPSNHRHPDRIGLSLQVPRINARVGKPLHKKLAPAELVLCWGVSGLSSEGISMTSTGILTEDAITIVADEGRRFNWGATIVGAIGATATMAFLLALGAGVGLSFLSVPSTARSATVFLSLGAIYFFAVQAFGFAVGGYLAGRLIGPAAESTKEEEFRAAVHGFTVWALSVVASLLIAGASSTIAGAGLAAGAASGPASDNSDYFTDLLFRPAPATPQVAADKAEAGRILAMARSSDDSDTARLVQLISKDTGLSQDTARARVQVVEASQRLMADNARKAAAIISLWSAFALLFGAVVAVAAAISARWMDDRISFSMAPRLKR
jgi:hypothetical protein